MSEEKKGQWMSLKEIQEETGLSRCTVYAAAQNGTLPVPVHRFGKRILVSRKAWESLHNQHHETEEDNDNGRNTAGQ